MCVLTACSKDVTTPITIDDTTNALLGDWALVRITGGVAGIDESYPPENSPRTLDFQINDLRNTVLDKTDTTTTTSSFFVQDLTDSNDTTFFTFSPIRDGSANFVLSGRPMYLIGQRVLQTAPICCDFFDFRFEKI